MPRPFWKDALEVKRDTTLIGLEAIVWQAWEEGDAPAANAALDSLLAEWGDRVHQAVVARLRDGGWTMRSGRWYPADVDNLRTVTVEHHARMHGVAA